MIQAQKVRLAAVGISDHDTAGGLAGAIEAGRDLGIEVVPGVEINTDSLGVEVHVLGYYFDRSDGDFLDLLRRLRDGRAARGEEMVRRLRRAGLDISWDRVLEIAGGGSVGRPHVARALEEAGYVASTSEAFDRWLVPGKRGYVERYKLSPADAVRAVRRAGGVPVLAHPGLVGRDEIIPDLVEAGLMGLEVYHPDHGAVAVRRYGRLAGEMGLIATGGSDFHGPGGSHPWKIGHCAVDYEAVEKLKRAAGPFC